LGISADRTKIRIWTDSLRQYFIHEIKMEGVKAASGEHLLHSTGYYTLNQLSDSDPGSWEKSNLAAAPAPHAHHAMPAEPAPAASVAAAAMPSHWTQGPDQTITLGTQPGLQFDQTKIQVKAGSKIALIFNNNDDMTHNFVLVQPNAIDEVVNAALKLGLKGSEVGYVPKTAKVIVHTGLLEPGTSQTIYFVAPNKPGTYGYVCTYPGHGAIMRGVLRVVP
jgi:azurin